MSEIMSAAFLVFLASQQPCPDNSFSVSGTANLLKSHETAYIVPVSSEQELGKLVSETYLGPACRIPSCSVYFGAKPGCQTEWEVQVLDVRRGRWRTYWQSEDTRKVVREVEEKTGKYHAREGQ